MNNIVTISNKIVSEVCVNITVKINIIESYDFNKWIKTISKEILYIISEIVSTSIPKSCSMFEDIKKIHNCEPDEIIFEISSYNNKSDIIYLRNGVILRRITSNDIFDPTNPSIDLILNTIKCSEKNTMSRGNITRLNSMFKNTYVYDYFKTDNHNISVSHGYTFENSEEIFISNSQYLNSNYPDIAIYSDNAVEINNEEYFIKQDPIDDFVKDKDSDNKQSKEQLRGDNIDRTLKEGKMIGRVCHTPFDE